MAELLLEFRTPVRIKDSPLYRARACGAPASDGTARWHAWIEFTPVGGGPRVRTGRETTQPNRVCAEYWATGLGVVYLRGALERALNPSLIAKTSIDGAAASDAGALLHGGESRLRKRLAGFPRKRLVHTLLTYSFGDQDLEELQRIPTAALIDRVVAAVHKRLDNPPAASAAPIKDDKTIIDLIEHLTGGISVVEGNLQASEAAAPSHVDQTQPASLAPSDQAPHNARGDRRED